MTKIRTGQAPASLTHAQFQERFQVRFYDPAFEGERDAIARLEAIAWKALQEGRKAPITQPAGRGFADPTYKISVQWLNTRKRLKAAQKLWSDSAAPSRVLLVCGSARNDGTRASGLLQAIAVAVRARPGDASLYMQVFTCLSCAHAQTLRMDADKVFKALGDPTRTKLLDLLYEKNGQTLGELCEQLDMTRQSATQHIGILEAANLVTTVWRGREKLHFINPVPLHEVYERWVRKFERQRLSLLHDLKTQLEGDQS